MKKILKIALFSFLTVGLFAGMAKANPFSNFKTYASTTLLKPFVEDFGGLLGGADFNTGRTLGFPGFDAGLAFSVQAKPDPTNLILKNAKVGAFGLPLAQVSAGLPLVGADLTLRGVSYSGLSIVGGGVRYPVFKSGTLTKFIPDISVAVFYDTIDYTYFKGSHMSFDVSASLNIPIIKPFAGIGLDRTKLEVKNISGLNGVDASISKPRYTVGVKISPMPLIYVYGAYSSLHGQGGYQAGLGARF